MLVLVFRYTAENLREKSSIWTKPVVGPIKALGDKRRFSMSTHAFRNPAMSLIGTRGVYFRNVDANLTGDRHSSRIRFSGTLSNLDEGSLTIQEPLPPFHRNGRPPVEP